MFCRFLELYLVSAFHAVCAIGIIATNIAVRSKRSTERVGDLVMRTGSSDILSRGHRGRNRLDARLKKGRKSRFCWFDLEGLESRTLLATTYRPRRPPVRAIDLSGNLSSISASTNDGNANSPAVAIDPYDSQKLFAVWGVDVVAVSPTVPYDGRRRGSVLERWRDDLDESWPRGCHPAARSSTVNSTSPPDYTQVTDPSVAFDAKGDVYVLTLQTSGASRRRAVPDRVQFLRLLRRPQVTLPNNGIVYQWVTGSDAATTPVMAVDTVLNLTRLPTPMRTMSTSPGPASTPYPPCRSLCRTGL